MKIEGLLDFAIDISEEGIGPGIWVYICVSSKKDRYKEFSVMQIDRKSWEFDEISIGPQYNQPYVEC